ncbi:MAG: hypothetical protein KJP04_00125 [Arenicella sp.]|nr:hypothetical protein [Arenicella sp.]
MYTAPAIAMPKPVITVLALFSLSALLLGCDTSDRAPQHVLSDVEAVELLELTNARPFLTMQIDIDVSELIEKVDLSAKGKALMMRGYLKSEPMVYIESRPLFAEQYDLQQIKLAPSIMDALLRYTAKRNTDPELLPAYNSIASARLQIGRISEASVTSLKASGRSRYTVHYNLTIELNDLGSILYPEGLRIPWAAEFDYGADGWQRQLGYAQEMDGLLRDEFAGFVSRPLLIIRGLRAMYKAGVYPPDWRDFVGAVEDTKEFAVLEDVAWAYHNNGESARAISIYESKILPAVAHTQPIEVIVRLEEQLEQIQSAASNDTPAELN